MALLGRLTLIRYSPRGGASRKKDFEVKAILVVDGKPDPHLWS